MPSFSINHGVVRDKHPVHAWCFTCSARHDRLMMLNAGANPATGWDCSTWAPVAFFCEDHQRSAILIFAFILCLSDAMHTTRISPDQHRKQAATDSPSVSSENDLLIMMTKGLFHLLATVFTSTGMQPPFESLLRLARQESSVAEKSSNENTASKQKWARNGRGFIKISKHLTKICWTIDGNC